MKKSGSKSSCSTGNKPAKKMMGGGGTTYDTKKMKSGGVTCGKAKKMMSGGKTRGTGCATKGLMHSKKMG